MGTVLITGLTGFVGSWVARELAGAGWRIVGVKRSTSKLDALGDLAEKIELYDVESLLGAFDAARDGFDAVVHVATDLGRATGPDGRSLDTPPGSGTDSRVLEANVAFPLRLLEHAVARNVSLFVNTDTCVPPRYPAMRPYALSKRAFLDWGRALCEGSGTRFVNVRLCQPYGPRERPAMFVPWLIGQCLRSEGEIKMTPGGQRRDFVYAADVARAFRLVLERAGDLPSEFASLDCGTGWAIAIREFTETVHRLTRSRATLAFGALPYRPEEFSWEADAAGLRALGWEPTVSLEDGLRRTLREDFGFE